MEKELKKLRPEENAPQWAFSFLQSIPGVTVVLSGMSDMKQLKENIEIWKEDKPLNKEEMEKLISLADEETKKVTLQVTYSMI